MITIKELLNLKEGDIIHYNGLYNIIKGRKRYLDCIVQIKKSTGQYNLPRGLPEAMERNKEYRTYFTYEDLSLNNDPDRVPYFEIYVELISENITIDDREIMYWGDKSTIIVIFKEELENITILNKE